METLTNDPAEIRRSSVPMHLYEAGASTRIPVGVLLSPDSAASSTVDVSAGIQCVLACVRLLI